MDFLNVSTLKINLIFIQNTTFIFPEKSKFNVGICIVHLHGMDRRSTLPEKVVLCLPLLYWSECWPCALVLT